MQNFDRMHGEINLRHLLASLQPEMQEGDYIFCSMDVPIPFEPEKMIGSFTEKEGRTIIIEKVLAYIYGNFPIPLWPPG